MQINKLELKNIKYFASGSEETPCYNADIFINGKKAIHVSNHGYGACDDHYPFKPFTYKDVKDLEKYLAKLEEDDFEPIDSWCHDRLYEYLDQKKLKRDLKAKFICIDKVKNELYAYKKNGSTLASFGRFFKENHPNDECLNVMTFHDACKIFNEVTS